MSETVTLHPAAGPLNVLIACPPHPRVTVLLWLDVRGVRPAAVQLAEDLAAEGAAVVAPQYLRTEVGDAPLTEAQRNELRVTRDALTLARWRVDLDAVLGLISADARLTRRPLLTVGTCIGAGYALATLAAAPQRVSGTVLVDPCELSDRRGTALHFGAAASTPVTSICAAGTEAYAPRLAALGVPCTEQWVQAKHGFPWVDWTENTFDSGAASETMGCLIRACHRPTR